MMLRYSLEEPQLAAHIEEAVSLTLDDGLRTGDIFVEGCRKVGTTQMGDAVVGHLRNLAQ
jgi:3-isopropylmalate dehydrogenase